MTEPLDAQHAERARELNRLFRFLTRPGPRFGLGLAISRDPIVANELRERLRALVEAEGVKLGTAVFTASDDRHDLVARMRDAAQGVDAVFVVGLDRLMLDSAGRVRKTSAVANLNQRRDSLPGLLDARVVFWLSKPGELAMRDQAWDLRQIMLTVAEFNDQAPVIMHHAAPGLPLDWLSLIGTVDEGEVDEVLSHADTLTMVAKQAVDPRTRADTAFSAGQAYASAARLDAAVEWLGRAVTAYDEVDDIDQASAARAMLGRVLFGLGRFEEAIDIHERALAGYTQLDRLDGQANELANLGICYQRLGDFNRALRLHEGARVIEQQLGRLGGQATDLGNLGICYRAQGDIAKAIASNERALAIWEQVGRLDGQAEVLGNLGLCYWAQDDMWTAIGLLERALAIHEQLGARVGQAAALRHLGECYLSLGFIEEKAIELFERALAIEEQLGRLDMQAILLNRLALCYRAQADVAKAINLQERALELETQLGNLEGQADALSRLGHYYRTHEDIAKAIDSHQRALRIWEQVHGLQGQAANLANLGFIATGHGTPEQARAYLTRALELYRSLARPEDHPHIATLTRALTDLAELQP